MQHHIQPMQDNQQPKSDGYDVTKLQEGKLHWLVTLVKLLIKVNSFVRISLGKSFSLPEPVCLAK